MLLSFIIPFFNSEKKSKRLLATLASIEQSDIELVFVDDGSTDNTYEVLSKFQESHSTKNIKLIKQHNKGPGGARNTGLNAAKGDYVWFVDSDDDIAVEAIEVVRQHSDKHYDFIDFNVLSDKEIINTMRLNSDNYTVTNQSRVELLENFGRVSSKVFRRNLITDNNILYPEYCFYEDNSLRFIYPFYIKTFFKTELVGYLHHLEFESVTRSKTNLKTLDRLHTAVYGFEEGKMLAKEISDIRVLENKFIEKYLIETFTKYATKKPSKSWLIIWKVMKQYRNIAKEFDIQVSPFSVLKKRVCNNKLKAFFTFIGPYLTLQSLIKINILIKFVKKLGIYKFRLINLNSQTKGYFIYVKQ